MVISSRLELALQLFTLSTGPKSGSSCSAVLHVDSFALDPEQGFLALFAGVFSALRHLFFSCAHWIIWDLIHSLPKPILGILQVSFSHETSSSSFKFWVVLFFKWTLLLPGHTLAASRTMNDVLNFGEKKMYNRPEITASLFTIQVKTSQQKRKNAKY